MSTVKKLRKCFNPVNKSILQWFPGHMGRGVKQMQQRLTVVDCVIEVHDARIPFSGRNQLLRHKLLGVKPHILVFNKCDLTDISKQKEIIRFIKDEEKVSEVLYTDCRNPDGEGVKEILPTVINTMKNANRYNRSDARDLCLMVIGVPNVGKSSLINVMRNRYTKKSKGTAVGGVAGVTRSVLNKIMVSYYPPVYLLDTPGILEPSVTDVEAAYRLALCASMQDHLVGIVNIADYLLYWLNRNNNLSYVDYFQLEEATDEIMSMLVNVAVKNNLYTKSRDVSTGQTLCLPNFNRSAELFVGAFRKGSFGLAMLDNDRLPASIRSESATA